MLSHKLAILCVKYIPVIVALTDVLAILTEEEAIELVSVIGHYTNREEYISKYEACKYLNISRATFDNYVKEGKLPKGKKRIGFKELAWTKKDLDEAVKKLKAKSR